MDNWDVLEEDFEKNDYEDYCTIIVIYDIISNKRRTRLSKILSGFGYRIQKSSFECVLTKEKCDLLVSMIDDFAIDVDFIRIYKLNRNVKTIIYGSKPDTENKIYYFF